MLYTSVAQAVLLFGYVTSVISVAMDRKNEGTHTGFFR